MAFDTINPRPYLLDFRKSAGMRLFSRMRFPRAFDSTYKRMTPSGGGIVLKDPSSPHSPTQPSTNIAVAMHSLIENDVLGRAGE